MRLTPAQQEAIATADPDTGLLFCGVRTADSLVNKGLAHYEPPQWGDGPGRESCYLNDTASRHDNSGAVIPADSADGKSERLGPETSG